MNDAGISFGTIRKYCSRLDRVSVYMLETMRYESFARVEDVPAGYDGFYLYGFGVIDSEFPEEAI